MFTEEFVKPNGHVLWRWYYEAGEAYFYNVGILTSDTLVTQNFWSEPSAFEAWKAILDAKTIKKYAKHLGSGFKEIALADVTRVENGLNSNDLQCVTVFWDDEGKQRTHEIPATGDLPVFNRLRDQLAPKTKIKKGLATIGSRMFFPLGLMAITFLGGCGCCFPLAFFATNSNPDTVSSRRGQALGWILKILGPVGVAAVVVLILIGLGIWLAVRIAKRPKIRYFEARKKGILEPEAEPT
jgi:hypothetical protein